MAIELAMKQNRSVRQSRNNIESSSLNLAANQSDFDLKITPAAGIGITQGNEDITAGVTLTQKFTQGSTLSLSPAVGKISESFIGRVGLSLAIPLFRGRGELVNTTAVRGAEYALRSAQRSLHRIRTQIIIQTVTRFFTIIRYKKKVAMNRQLLKQFRNHSALARLKSDLGLAGPLDVYRAEIKVKDAQADLADAMEALQKERLDLKSILSITQDTPVEIQDAPVEIMPVTLTVPEAEKIALKNSIDILQEKDAVNEIQRNSKIARHNLLPDLKLGLSYSRTGESDMLSDLFSLDEDDWRISLSSSTDFSRTREKLTYQQSLLSMASARIDMENTRDGVKKNLRSQMDTLEKARERIDIRNDQIHQAQGKKALAQVKFNNDMADNFNLVEAETELYQARLNFLQARIDYIIGTYRLREIMGTLLAYHEN